MMIIPDGFGVRVWRHPAVAQFTRFARAKTALLLQIVLVVFLIAQLVVSGEMPIVRQWALFALHALTFPLRMWNVDGAATLLASLSYMAKLALALMPTVMLVWCAPKWRILACLFAALVLVASVSFVRACPVWSDWVLLVAASMFGTFLVRRRFLRWAAILPVIVLVVLPAVGHGNARHFGATLAARCAANEGERATNLDPSQFAPRYYGVHFFPPDWILLTGETANDGNFMGMSHGGQGSWWLRKEADGRISFAGRSEANGNIWTSCLLGDERWLVRSGRFMRIQPPGPDGRETLQMLPFQVFGFENPDTACDERTGAVYASDLLDGRLYEVSSRTDGRPELRPDSLSVRGGLMSMRKNDGRLVMLDFQDLIVYAPDESRVVHRTPAAVASSSLDLCAADGAAVVPDLAGRLRVFRVTPDGGYEFDWGLSLFAPRAARFSPNCAYLAVTSADDRHVWIIERSSRRIIREFGLGPALRGLTFIGPREVAVADACTVSVLRF